MIKTYALVVATLFGVAACGSSGGGRRLTPTTPEGPVVDVASLSVDVVEDNLLQATLILAFAPATGGSTRSSDFEYRAYWSLHDDLRTADGVERYGTPGTEWETGVTQLLIAGLEPGRTYYVNVLVRDDRGLTTAYQDVQVDVAPRVAIRVRNLTGAQDPIRFVAYGAGFTPTPTVDPQVLYDLVLPPDGEQWVRGELAPLRLTATVGASAPLPEIAAQVGQRYGPDATASSLVPLGPSATPNELTLVNTTAGTVMDGMVTALGMPYVRLLHLAPGGEQALAGFRPSWLVGASTMLDGGPPPVTSLATEVDLLGIRSADLVISLTPSQAFEFTLLNVMR